MTAAETKDSIKLPIGFPKGLRVLLVDDDSLCLKIVERMLCSCEFVVTTCTNGQNALHQLREKPHGYDLVISDVYMPDMDGFKLLELVGLEMDLPVIMMSSNGETGTVLRGVTHGAVDFLIKPVRIEELRNIWQHVIRRKRELVKDPESEEQSQEGKEEPVDLSRKRKDGGAASGELERSGDGEEGYASKKARVVWSAEMHQQFVNAVNQLGVDKAVPKRILEIMNVGGLTRENIASHLQKYRLYLKRVAAVHKTQASPGMGSGRASKQQAAAQNGGIHMPVEHQGGAMQLPGPGPDMGPQQLQPAMSLPDPPAPVPSPVLQAALQQQQQQANHVSDALQLAGLAGQPCLPPPFPPPILIGGNPIAMMGAGAASMNSMMSLAGMNSLHPMGLPGMPGLPGMMHGMQGMGGMGGLALAGMQAHAQAHAQAQAGLAGMGGLQGMPGMGGLAGMGGLMGGMAGLMPAMHGMHGLAGMGGMQGLPGASGSSHEALLRGMHQANMIGHTPRPSSACASQPAPAPGLQTGGGASAQAQQQQQQGAHNTMQGQQGQLVLSGQGQQGQQGSGHHQPMTMAAMTQHHQQQQQQQPQHGAPSPIHHTLPARLPSDLAPLPDDPGLFGLQSNGPGSGPGMGLGLGRGACGPQSLAAHGGGCMMMSDHLDHVDVAAAFANLYSPDDDGIPTLHAADSKEAGLDEVLNFLLKS